MRSSKDTAKVGESHYINNLIHITMDLYDCKNVKSLSEIDIAEQILMKAAKVANMKVVGKRFYKFGDTPHAGLTGVLLLAKSHVSIHTYPLHNFVAVDIFTCDSKHIMSACNIFKDFFKPLDIDIETRKRAKKFHNIKKVKPWK